MSKAKKVLPDHLLSAVAAHLSPEGDASQSAKAITKTLGKLANQLRKQRKAVATPAAPTPSRRAKRWPASLLPLFSPTWPPAAKRQQPYLSLLSRQ